MKIIENMNAQKLTEKKIASKLEFIKRYAARPSIREDAFGGKEKEKVAEAVQACIDLTKQHEELKRALDYTNLVTSVEVAGRQYTLHSLILHKRTLCRMKRQVWAALDDRQAIMEIEQIRARQSADSKLNVQVVYNYDIEKRDNERFSVDELESQIDSALQIANSKVDIVEPPAPILTR